MQTVDYATPELGRTSVACSFGIFVPTVIAVGAIVVIDFVSLFMLLPELRPAAPFLILGLPTAAGVATGILLWRWWRQLHVAAKVGAMLVAIAAGLFVVVTVKFGY